MIRIFAAALLVAGCSGFGYSLAAGHRRQVRMLQQLIRGLQEMEWELKYRLTELPELCFLAGTAAGGPLKEIFHTLADKLRRNEATEISGCLNEILGSRQLPRYVRRNMKQLGLSLGRYDLEGQLQGLECVRQQCRADLMTLSENSDMRLRNYQTLTICGGVALAIILI